MKAALFEKPGRLLVAQKALRALKSDEVLVAVSACGICGTDLHIVEGQSHARPPVVLGHEFTGRIADVGSEVRDFAVGDSVAVDPNISCGRCFYCRRGEPHLCEHLLALGVDIDGGMAESTIVPRGQLYKLPDGMKPETAAFIEPLSCVVHGIDRAGIRAGDRVVIVGGGTVGLLLLQLAVLSGASRTYVVEPVEWKRTLAEKLGAHETWDPKTTDVKQAILDETTVGADVVIESAGLPGTVSLSLDLARRGGSVLLFGVCPFGMTVPLEPHRVYARELTIRGSFVNPFAFQQAVQLLAEKKVRIDDFVIDRFPLDGVSEAFEALRSGKTIKSLIIPR